MRRTFNSDFWHALEELVAGGTVVIDRPKGSAHPRYAHVVYPLDYGYLDNTSAMDGGGIDLWRGSDPAQKLSGVIVTVDLLKRDSEIKLLIGMTEEETQIALSFHNNAYMKGLLVPREG